MSNENKPVDAGILTYGATGDGAKHTEIVADGATGSRFLGKRAGGQIGPVSESKQPVLPKGGSGTSKPKGK